MNGFDFCPPEEEGLASEKIIEFIDFIKRTRINLHSFMLLRHGRVLAEAYYKPFDKAGSYGIQEWIGYVAVESMEGSSYNIMGLPVHQLYVTLNQFV